MTNLYGPWATAIDAGRNPRLSAFWRQRLTMLVPTSRTSPKLSRRNAVLLVAAASLVFLLPTFRAAPAVAQQQQPSRESSPAKLAPAGKPAPPDIRLVDAELTPEAIERFAGKHWGTVTLVTAKLDGTILEALSQAASIHSLRLFGGAGLNGQIPRLQNVKGLRGLEIGAPLTGYSVEAIAALTQLEELGLPQELTVNVSGARELAKLVNLKSLGLYNVNIDDASFAELRPLVRLERLDLTHTRITDKGLRTVENMPHLNTLELDRYSFSKEQLTDACLPSIMRLSELETLSLSGQITNAGLVQVAKLPKLKSLGIFHTEIDGSGLESLENSSVEHLTAGVGQIDSEPALKSLKKCRALKSMLIYGGIVTLPDPLDEKLRRELPKVSVMRISN